MKESVYVCDREKERETFYGWREIRRRLMKEGEVVFA